MPLTLTALKGLPEVRAGDDVAGLIGAGLSANGVKLGTRDALVICQKIVSKAEGRMVNLAAVTPSAEAVRLAAITGKEPAYVELVLRESVAILRVAPGVIVVRDKRGLVLANAGIDQSNVPGGGALLLPEDPDATAQTIRDRINQVLGVKVAVLINDSLGRAWRLGTVGTCIGCAGFRALIDMRGVPDREGRSLRITEVAAADELAAAASLLMGQAGEGRPVIVAQGLSPDFFATATPARTLLRPVTQDLFQ